MNNLHLILLDIYSDSIGIDDFMARAAKARALKDINIDDGLLRTIFNCIDAAWGAGYDFALDRYNIDESKGN